MKCSYYKCKKTQDIPHFRFPVKNKELLEKWIENSGNDELKTMSLEQLANKRICINHFNVRQVHIGRLRAKLRGPAVPNPAKKTDEQYISEGRFNPNKVLNTYSRTKQKAKLKVTPLYEVKVEPVAPTTSKTNKIQRNIRFKQNKNRASKDIKSKNPDKNEVYFKIKTIVSNHDDQPTHVKTEDISVDESDNMEPGTANGTFSRVKMEQNFEDDDHVLLKPKRNTDGIPGNIKMEASDEAVCYIKIEPKIEEES